RISCRKGEEQVAAMAKMVRGLAAENDAVVTEGLLELLFWHRNEVKKPYNKIDPKLYFCLPAVGLSILAVRPRILQKSQLPKDEYLPLDLIPDGSPTCSADEAKR